LATSQGWYWTTSAGRFNIGNSITTYGNWHSITKTLSSNYATLFLGFAHYNSSSTLTNAALATFYDGSSIQLQVRIDATGKLYFVNSAGTTLTDTLTSSVRLKTNVWKYIEIEATIADSIAGDSCIIRANGVQVCNLTAGQDTKNTANAYTNKIQIGWINSDVYAQYIGDLYLCDTTGTTNNTFLGDVRVTTLYPSGNGNYNQFVGSDSNNTDNYLLVDEATPNTDYVQEFAVNEIDSYAFTDMAQTPTTIFGMQTNIYATQTDTGTRKITPLTRLDSTDYLGTEFTMEESYTMHMGIAELNPADSAAWEKADVDGAEFGFKITA
jgi:hypothetical protein